MKHIKIPILFVLTLVCTSISVLAQTSRFDITNYQSPKGWKSRDQDGAKVFTTTDESKGTVCLITLYKSEASSGNLTTDFAQSWQKYVTANLGKSDYPQTSTDKTLQSWDLIAGGSIVETGELGKMAASMVVMSKAGRKVTVLAVSNSADYLPIYEQFLESLRFDANSSPTSSNPIKPTVEKFEIWMGVQNGQFDIGWETSMDWKIVFPNGDYFDQLPRDGFLNFNRNATGGNWGKFTFANGRGSFKSKFENTEVKSTSAGRLEKIGYAYGLYKVASVEGITLSGGYVLYANNRKDPYYRQSGCRQIFYFDKNGEFDDRGIWADCRPGRIKTEDAPGKGTYQIKNYTLILKYSDGRIITKPFSGVIDKPLSSDDTVLYVGGNPWFKIN